jgi:carbamate kinase
MGQRVVIALGGNAINKPGQRGISEEQFANVRDTAKQIVNIIKEGFEVIITHGNGPQVGAVLIQQEVASKHVPAMPLDVCGSETQGQIAYMIQQSLGNELKKENINKDVISLITQVIVNKDDEAFVHPRKPVGPFFNEEHALKMIKEKGEYWIEDAGRGWRKLVPSPRPIGIVEIDAIKFLVKNGFIVIASGGGGIPVTEDKYGLLQGVEAVIDKDRAGEKLAEEVEADVLMILTDVPYAAINYGTPEQMNLNIVRISEMKEYLNEGYFKAGSMGPKVESAVKFVESGGDRAIIASLEQGFGALIEDKGTIIIKD